MRSDIRPGGIFPDYALSDHTNTVRTLKELQGDDPLVLTLATGQLLSEGAPAAPGAGCELPEGRRRLHPDRHDLDRRPPLDTRVPRLGRRPVDLSFRSRSDRTEGSRHPGIHRPRARPDDPPYARAQAGAGDSQHLQRVLVLGSPVLLRPVRSDLCAASSEIRPDWDLSKPGLREAWDAADYSMFHGWNKRASQSMPHVV